MLLKNLWRQYYSFNNHENNFCSNNLAAKFALQTPESCRFSLDSLPLVLATACKADFPTVLSFFSAMTLKFSKKKTKSHISYTNSNKLLHAHSLTLTHMKLGKPHSHLKQRFYLTLICPVMNWAPTYCTLKCSSCRELNQIPNLWETKKDRKSVV